MKREYAYDGRLYIGMVPDVVAQSTAATADLGKAAFSAEFGVPAEDLTSKKAVDWDKRAGAFFVKESYLLENPSLGEKVAESRWASEAQLVAADAAYLGWKSQQPNQRESKIEEPKIAFADREYLHIPRYQVENGQVKLDAETQRPVRMGEGFLDRLTRGQTKEVQEALKGAFEFDEQKFNEATKTYGQWAVSKSKLQEIGGLEAHVAPFRGEKAMADCKVAQDFETARKATVVTASRERTEERVFVGPERVIGMGRKNLLEQIETLRTPEQFGAYATAIGKGLEQAKARVVAAEEAVDRKMKPIADAAIAEGRRLVLPSGVQPQYNEAEKQLLHNERVQQRLDAGPRPRGRLYHDHQTCSLGTIAEKFEEVQKHLADTFNKRNFTREDGSAMTFDDLTKGKGGKSGAAPARTDTQQQAAQVSSLIDSLGIGR